jgi:hypothetical protein
MRDITRDELWLREVAKMIDLGEVVYVTPAYYDGGYELRVGTVTVFVEYEVIDEGGQAEVIRRYKKKL